MKEKYVQLKRNENKIKIMNYKFTDWYGWV